MRSKIATKLLNEMSEEHKQKVDKEADKLVLSNVSNRDFFCNNTEYKPPRKKCDKICGACSSWEHSKRYDC